LNDDDDDQMKDEAARITLICMGRMTKYILVRKSEAKRPF
jgi:hypothetical protein